MNSRQTAGVSVQLSLATSRPQERFELRAKVVFNATGVWADELAPTCT